MSTMSFRCVLRAAAMLCFLLVCASAAPLDPGEPCQPDKLTVYKMVLHTFWSRDTFPKHYPDWRPPAQWSKVFGQFFNFILISLIEILSFSRADLTNNVSNFEPDSLFQSDILSLCHKNDDRK
ncbi:unnamed protein product [Acanthoscelides obtectus]|uniref:Spondin domain-containing protein n=1 Tax=Acanthoscelides obtectus TaxID=200917 RepID=A0A9P0LFG0_ACAOB|nr:unnamed protein product [Acanthoscelides obtectus]CAK1635197.1 hypothetical protein AOBTE_LOCUS9129 [Acanthoscelides obtectus]